MTEERLQKYLARAGVASRRHAEELITAGRVTLNNGVVTEMGTKVTLGRDLVAVDGKLVTPPESLTYVLLYKPPGVVTTLSDPEGRPTVKELIPKDIMQRLFPVGRLDYDAEGALILTDDGDLANRLMHPSFQVSRTYLAKVKGVPLKETLEKLRGGVRLEDGPAKPLSVDVFEVAEKNTWIKIVVAEGRPHLIKRLCAAIGHPVVRLFRPFQAGIGLGGMKPGQTRMLTKEEVLRVKSISEGEKYPEPDLNLPARRHGHTGEDAEGDEEPVWKQQWRSRVAKAPGARDGGFAPPKRRAKPNGNEDSEQTERPPRRESSYASKGPQRQTDSDARPPRRATTFGGRGQPRREVGSSERAPRRETGFASDRKSPRREGGSSSERGPRREASFSSDRKPRREGGFSSDRKPPARREGGFSSDRKPPARREGGFSSDRKPPGESGFGLARTPRAGSSSAERKPRADDRFSSERKPPRREGGFSSDRGPRREDTGRTGAPRGASRPGSSGGARSGPRSGGFKGKSGAAPARGGKSGPRGSGRPPPRGR